MDGSLRLQSSQCAPSRMSLSPVPRPYVPINGRQEHRRSHDIRKQKNCRGSAQRGGQAVLAFHSRLGLKSCHIMATSPELEIDTEAPWGASYSRSGQQMARPARSTTTAAGLMFLRLPEAVFLPTRAGKRTAAGGPGTPRPSNPFP